MAKWWCGMHHQTRATDSDGVRIEELQPFCHANCLNFRWARTSPFPLLHSTVMRWWPHNRFPDASSIWLSRCSLGKRIIIEKHIEKREKEALRACAHMYTPSLWKNCWLFWVPVFCRSFWPFTHIYAIFSRSFEHNFAIISTKFEQIFNEISSEFKVEVRRKNANKNISLTRGTGSVARTNS